MATENGMSDSGGTTAKEVVDLLQEMTNLEIADEEKKDENKDSKTKSTGKDFPHGLEKEEN